MHDLLHKKNEAIFSKEPLKTQPGFLEVPRYYFDWAATAVPDIILPQTDTFGNPSSFHREGRAAREALEAARTRCAAVLGVPVDTVYFTSGGTESNCIALYSCLAKQGCGRILVSAGEHPSITENIQKLERMGKPVGRIPIDSFGRVTPQLLKETLTQYSDARFAAIMAVNNETGTINDMGALHDVIHCKEGPPVHLHCDIVQAVGKIPMDIFRWGIDSASLSAHKIGGPRGIGLLYLKQPLEVLYSGGGQENKVRPGTENVAGALALAACLENHALPEKLNTENAAARNRWKCLIATLHSIDRCRIIPEDRDLDDKGFSPYILQVAFKGVPGEVMVRVLDDKGFAVSTGSACSSSSQERPVLSAMGIDGKLGVEGIRISQGWSSTEKDIDLLLAAITEALKFL